MAVIYQRAVRFEEVDAAGIAFFARFFNWCHEAMERFFDGVPGGYVGLIIGRKLGFPAVHLTADWKMPLRYGDIVSIATSVTKVGCTSATFRYVLTRESDGAHVATVEHVTVATDLDTMTKRPLPDDCRALLETHRTPS
jgi:4-hydroxybenzoyl-CoA thioesterase